MEIAFKTQRGQAYPIGQVGGHDKVVLDNETGLLGVQNETFDNLKKDEAITSMSIRNQLVKRS